ncbi:MMPL family transporter [Kutzneria sp. CA-103260]|uniref:MMPL family transporter n=1 Tax=Kutzneria sp. CA-103260 TaxID=2802641 RepID=UPI001BA7AAFB|nr:MMPL family transporter [Kutzneria sp. CA-103260]QUQ72496.1 integral membrane protein [Kutzneria sp. CA-103260]
MLTRLGHRIVRHARTILLIAAVALLGFGFAGSTVFGKLGSQGLDDPSSQASRAGVELARNFGGDSQLVFLVTATTGTVDSPSVKAAGLALTTDLSRDSRVATPVSYWSAGAPQLRSSDGRSAMITARVGLLSDDAVQDILDQYSGSRGPVSVAIGGSLVGSLQIKNQVSHDLLVSEAIAVPVIGLLLFLVFGSAVAALLPLLIGGITILGTLAALSVLGSLTNVSIYAVNVTTALGFGLSIDYGLLMVNRFREELAGGATSADAAVSTVRVAGRTIGFSAATVVVALATLLVFPQYFLRSFAYAGISVIAIAMLSATVVLPAVLSLIGARINTGRLPWARKHNPATTSVLWKRLATGVMRRPAWAAIPVLLVLLTAATPLLGITFGSPDEQVLSTSGSSRVVGDALRAGFPNVDTRPIQTVLTGSADRAAVADYARRVSELSGVTGVQSPVGAFAGGKGPQPTPLDPTLAHGDAKLITVSTDLDIHSQAAEDLVNQVRDVAAPAGDQVLVGGDPALQLDDKTAVGDRVLPCALIIALATFILLFLLTGSVLQPLRALALNLIGLGATLGLMVLIFEHGAGSAVLGFTPLPLDTSMLMLLFVISFGLSMDYEVFVTSRIKEAHDQGVPTSEAVINGLSRSGRIVSAAALLLAISLCALALSRVSFIQMFGLGTAIAVLMDATLIRGILLPAGIRILGRAAWWAPKPLRKLHRRFGLSETSNPSTATPPEPAHSVVHH